MMEKSAANSDRCDLHIYSVYQVHDQMHLSSWLVEAYMRFLYFSELNHNSEFISAFKGGGIIFFFHYSFSKLIWFDSISRASHRHYYTRPAALCL